MKRLFIQAKPFERHLKASGKDQEVLSEIESKILKNPKEGDLIKGTGGIRKLRVSDPHRGKGSRGGYRVLYLDLPEVDHTHLITIYSKDEKDDLTSDEKAAIKLLAEKIKGATNAKKKHSK